MSIAITDDHRALAETASGFLVKHGARGAARAMLEAPDERLPKFWADVAELGWLGLHVPEEYGGSGFGLPELTVVVEELGRAVAPGPFVPTVIASAIIAAGAPAALRTRLLPGLADGSVIGAVALGGSVELRDGAVHGPAGAVLGGGLADVLLVAVGDDVAVVDRSSAGVRVESPANIDPTRRAARVTFDGAAAEVIPGARQVLVDMSRALLAAEATGVARECTVLASEYAKVRMQFGRPIATFQAVKHHCANMLVATELATAAVWDAARATSAGGDQFSLTAAMAAALAVPAAEHNAQLNIQVHGGIGFTWEHDAHLYLRRAAAIEALLDADAPSTCPPRRSRCVTRSASSPRACKDSRAEPGARP
jgi:3-oxochol-4-en-24-oyl-CoA dehydrogenase